MPLLLKVVFIELITVGALGIALVSYDKFAARRGKRRISEITLFFIGIIGAAAPMLIAMNVVRHKTKKPYFYIGFPIIIILQVFAAYAYFYFTYIR